MLHFQESKLFSLTKRGHGFRVFRCCRTILDSQRLSRIMRGCSLCLSSCCSGWCVSSGLVDVEHRLKATHLRPETADGSTSSRRRSARHRRSPSTSLNPAIVPSLCLSITIRLLIPFALLSAPLPNVSV